MKVFNHFDQIGHYKGQNSQSFRSHWQLRWSKFSSIMIKLATIIIKLATILPPPRLPGRWVRWITVASSPSWTEASPSTIWWRTCPSTVSTVSSTTTARSRCGAATLRSVSRNRCRSPQATRTKSKSLAGRLAAGRRVGPCRTSDATQLHGFAKYHCLALM